ncbi:hypothetical protein NSQ26_01195 [Bacillus sp. FSL W7-1360]
MLFAWIALMALSCLSLNPQSWVRGLRRRPKPWFLLQAGRYVIGFVIGIVVIYFGLIDLSFTGLLSTFGVVVAINLIVTGLLESVQTIGTGKRVRYTFKLAKVQMATGALLLLVLLGLKLIYPLMVTKELATVGQIERSDEKIASVAEEAVRVVPHQSARYKSEIAFGNIENYSFYELGESNIQKIDDELYWVSPIEYANVWRWFRADHAPGYIMVSAEDPNAEARLVDGYEMKYVPSAFFHENLERHVRQAYGDVVLIGYSFEPDDEGRPYYAYSYARYEHYRAVPKAEGVILVDAETGEMEQYALGEQPDFVDRAIAPTLALDYAYWYGMYSNGLFNAWFAKEGVHEPTSKDDMLGVLGPEQEMYWMIDHMRPNQESNTMVGFTMVNARTGEATYYTGMSGMLNGRGAREVVNKSFQKEQWSGTQPVLYSVYGHYTWVVPVVDKNGLLREIAMVHAETGNISSAPSRKEVFLNYGQMLANDLGVDDYLPTDVLETKTVSGKVYRTSIGANEKYVRVLIEGESTVLEFDIAKHSDAVFIQPNDELEAEVSDTEENILRVESFTNKTMEKEFGAVEDFELNDVSEEEESETEE